MYQIRFGLYTMVTVAPIFLLLQDFQAGCVDPKFLPVPEGSDMTPLLLVDRGNKQPI
jgi:hypothetical protein